MRDTASASKKWAARLLVRAGVGAIGSVLALAAPCYADPPGNPVPIEQWSGLRRIDAGATSERAATSPDPSAPPVLPPTRPEAPPIAPTAPIETPAIIPAQAIIPPVAAEPSIRRADVPAQTGASEPRALPPLGPVGALDPATPARAPATPLTSPSEGQRGTVTTETPAPAYNTEGRQRESTESNLLTQTVCLFGAAFLGPLAAAGVVLLLVRRRVARTGPLFRIEYAGSVPVPMNSTTAPPRWERQHNPAATEQASIASPSAPTAGQVAAGNSQQEDAVLRALLADNLRMIEQLNERRDQVE